MNIEPRDITVRDLVEDYLDLQESGVTGYGGKLDIRPPYQREFVYKDKQRDAVIDTVTKNYPLNVMYWAVVENPTDDVEYEVIDGQQRTISLCQYVDGDFAFEGRYFDNLQPDEQEKILDYVLKVYVCTGSASEKLKWFETINIAGEKLTDQELLNAVYHGSWVTDAKKYFSKTACPAYQIGSNYMTGSPIRQEYLEKAIRWINDGNVKDYMATHQNKAKAIELWTYFQSVISWVESTFPTTRSAMKSVPWGPLYDQYKSADLDSDLLEQEVSRLFGDPDVTSQSGIYSFVLTENENFLSIRAFDTRMRNTAYEQQAGNCPSCKDHFELAGMQADHKTPWSKGGKTIAENCVMLCAPCNRKKWDV